MERNVLLSCAFVIAFIGAACGGIRDDNGQGKENPDHAANQTTPSLRDDATGVTLYSSPNAVATALVGEAVTVSIQDQVAAGDRGIEFVLDGKDWEFNVVCDWRDQDIESLERPHAEWQFPLDEDASVRRAADADDLLLFLRGYQLTSPGINTFVTDAVIVRVSPQGVSDPIHLTGVWLRVQDSNGDGQSEVIVGDGIWLNWRGVVPGHVTALNPRPQVAYRPLGHQLTVDTRAPNMLARVYAREWLKDKGSESAEEVLQKLVEEVLAQPIENSRRELLQEAMVEILYAGCWSSAVQLASQVYAESYWSESELKILLNATLAQFAESCIFEDLLVAYPELRQAYDR